MIFSTSFNKNLLRKSISSPQECHEDADEPTFFRSIVEICNIFKGIHHEAGDMSRLESSLAFSEKYTSQMMREVVKIHIPKMITLLLFLLIIFQ